MDPRDSLLLMLGFKGAGPTPGLDPVRVQKGMFLVAQEAGLPADGTYDFEPYNWGPYSKQLRADLNRLVAEGLATARDVPGYSWKRYALTAEGAERAREVLNEAPKEITRAIAATKRRVTGVSFNELLDDVYTAYPKYAEKSLFRS
jgi:uncharacterized protein YwgA